MHPPAAVETARDAPSQSRPVTVLYIGGYSRSGATLVSRALGQLPGFLSVGELGYLWKRTLPENRLCGCGARFLDCPFWAEVGRRAFGGWDNVDSGRMLALDRRVHRHRFIPGLVVPALAPGWKRLLRDYSATYSRLYDAIRLVAGADVIVDSTLDPTFGFALRRMPGVEPRIVHLVRDSRGAACSWTKRVRRADAVETPGYLRTYHPGSTALRWTLDHVLVHILGGLARRRMLLRYESFVASPRDELCRLAAYAGEDVTDEELPLVAPHVLKLETDHTVAGNRVRFHRGELTVRADEEWRTRLDPRNRRLVTLITWPLLQLYGYRGS